MLIPIDQALENYLEENMPLGKNADAGDYVKDFQKSKAPQFKGKSKEKRRKMAIAAYLDAKDKKESKMKSFDDLRNEAANPAQQAAIAINMKKRGVKPKDEEQMTPAQRAKAMADFKKRGGKVTKLPPGKAQGYHGKDDPGKGMRGMLDKPDSKAFGTRKKVRSLGASMKGMRNMGDMGKMDEQGTYDYGSPESVKLMKKTTPGQDANVDELAMYTSKKLPNLSYPKKKTKFDKEKARLDMLKKNKRKSESVEEATNFAVSIEGLPDMFMTADSPGMLKQTLRKIVKQPSMIQSVKRVTDAMVKKTFRLKAQGRDEEQDESVNELSYKTINRYAKKSKADADRATDSAVATIMRKGDHSKDLDTMRKRKKGMSMAKNRVLTKLRRGDK